MAEHPNATVVRRLYDAFRPKDGEALAHLIAEDAVWHVPGSTRISGDHRGQAAIFGYFQTMARMTGGRFHAELVDVLASDDHAAALAAATGKRDASKYDSTYLLLLQVEGGRIVDARLHNEDPAAFDAFWS